MIRIFLVASVTAAVLAIGPHTGSSAAGQQLTPSPWRRFDRSPRIEQLRRDLESGKADTTPFWAEIKSSGTPLIERLPGGTKHALVTFLYRGGPDTRNVVVFLSDFGGVRPADHMMSRLGQTDVWFLTVRLPGQARFIYRLSINDPLDNPFHGALMGGTLKLDELNPHHFFNIGSIAELPDAPQQPWLQKPVQAGIVSDAQTITSRLLKKNRKLWVYLPPGYEQSRSASNLVILFDGTMYANRLAAPTTLDNLIAAKRLSSTVVVFVETPVETRNDEMFWNTTYADFRANELVPWIRARYRVTKDARRVVVGGASAGGAGATYAALRHPRVFGNVLSQSGGFFASPERNRELAERSPMLTRENDDRHVVEEIEDRAVTEGGWLAKLFIKEPRLPIRFYLDVGVFEADFMGGGLGALEPNRHMRDVLLAKGYEVHYQEFMGGHDYISWRGTFADGILALIGETR